MTSELYPLFVFGAQRSGTTLLKRIVSKSPKIQFIPRETHIYPLFWKRNNRFSFNDNTILSDYIKQALPKVNNSWGSKENKKNLEQFTESIANYGPTIKSAGELIEYAFRYYTSSYGLEQIVVAEKTPSHIYYYKEILKHFPNAKFVIAIRDPRACALSEKIKLNNNERIKRRFNLLNFAARWETANALAIKMERELGGKKVHVVKYEDLILRPEPTIKNLCAFLEVEFLSEMLNMGVVNSSFKDDAQKGKNFNAENLDRWKEHLDKIEIERIEFFLHSTMRSFNYERYYQAGSRPTMTNLLKFKLAQTLTTLAPANFHHQVRHEKYKSI